MKFQGSHNVRQYKVILGRFIHDLTRYNVCEDSY